MLGEKMVSLNLMKKVATFTSFFCVNSYSSQDSKPDKVKKKVFYKIKFMNSQVKYYVKFMIF